MKKIYDVIVIGLGSMGSSSIYHLASRGLEVLGIEQFGIGNSKGSHSGQSRLVRKAYFEHTDYIPLLNRAYEGWDHLEAITGKQLYYPTGIAYFGDPENEIIRGVRDAATQYNIPLGDIPGDFERLIDTPAHYTSFLEGNAGYVFTIEAIQAYVEAAKLKGANILNHEKVEEVTESKGVCDVITNKGVYKAKKVVFTAGAYINELLEIPASKFEVTQQTLCWASSDRPDSEISDLPCWVITDENYDGLFYGFPLLNSPFKKGEKLIKIAHHVNGETVEQHDDKRIISDKELNKIEYIVNKYMGNYINQIKSVSECFYTYSKDGHFVLDIIPNSNEKFVIASGFSGHGFKFIPVVGEIIADLVIGGSSSLPVEFLSLQRFNS
ncbi:N-methyl-L-tryptophan oxidase [Balneola vulgaris]|uniref:N-methyl-L-tryptophan oxidase n=1 Tax=Balneola vulgaris TaxID=287535 RepID=UPI00037DD645|nr:N-methyl-L-tryptophan oxidase [Balneola vulgaris]